jgi:hypothetical protein
MFPTTTKGKNQSRRRSRRKGRRRRIPPSVPREPCLHPCRGIPNCLAPGIPTLPRKTSAHASLPRKHRPPRTEKGSCCGPDRPGAGRTSGVRETSASTLLHRLLLRPPRASGCCCSHLHHRAPAPAPRPPATWWTRPRRTSSSKSRRRSRSPAEQLGIVGQVHRVQRFVCVLHDPKMPPGHRARARARARASTHPSNTDPIFFRGIQAHMFPPQIIFLQKRRRILGTPDGG